MMILAKGTNEMTNPLKAGLPRSTRLLAAAAMLAVAGAAQAQPVSFRFEAAPVPFTPLHSYVYAKLPGYVFFIGGISGMGMHNITEGGGEVSFPLSVFSEHIYMLDESTNTLYSANLATSTVGDNLRELLRFTTPQFIQIGDAVHIYGGYGALNNGIQWTTKPNVVSVDLQALKTQMLAGTPLNAGPFTVLNSTDARATGGVIVKLGDRFALVGGARFTGDYGLGTQQMNPFQTQYTFAIKIFDPAVSLTNAVETMLDGYAFRRRDGNVMPVTLPDGEGATKPGFVVATGVFRNGFDIWEEPLLYRDGDNTVHFEQAFLQKANAYETANVSLYSASADTNRIIIMGGITYYEYYEKFGWFQNFAFPWTTQISEYAITAGEFVLDSEVIIGDTPLPFTNTHLLLKSNIPTNENGQVLLDQMPHNEVLIGRIYGGLFAQEPAASPVTFASSTVYNVYMKVGIPGDVNKDGIVNFSDLNAVLSQFGSPGFADLNLDGVVNFSDLNTVLSNFGRTEP